MTMGAVTLSDVGGTGSIPTWQVGAGERERERERRN
jgi:hypothetical protein